MKIEIRKTKESGIVQITTPDERWYVKELEDGTHVYVPSATWVFSYYPKGIAYFKWLASKGWDEAEAIKNEAANKGSKVHKAIDDLLEGVEVSMDTKYPNQEGKEEELSLEEYEALMSFANWWRELNEHSDVTIVSKEQVIWDDKLNIAGTVDLLIKVNPKGYDMLDGEDLWVIDYKTSNQIWPSHELQIDFYRQALKARKAAILQLNYKLNKTKKWKLTEIEDRIELILATKQIWENECKDITPAQKDYPLSLKLEIK